MLSSSLLMLAALAGQPSVADTVSLSSDRTYSGAEGELRVATPRLLDPGVRIDGELDEAVWDSAAVLHGFTQYDPVEGAPASQRTEILVFVTDDAIHFGVRAHDEGRSAVRASLAERDNVARNDDYVRFVLDTFDDQRRAYALTVNPLGVQQDGLWVEGGNDRRGFGDPIDDNPDFVWESGGRVQEWGWSAEVRVPFKSLRFPERTEQRWGLNVMRRYQRNGFEESWAPISGDVANKLTQAGALEGLTDLDPGLFLELNPVVTARRVGAFDAERGVFGHEGAEVDAGFNLTYGLTSNLTLDGTINPDFSQVEADAGQIVVNERFAVFFPEKRPFFLEGTEIFALPRQLVYTRSVVSPAAGAKITGKVGSLNLGYLGALDEAGADDQLVNLVRLRRDFGTSSTAGVLYTDRTGGGAFNRVAGADARLVFGGRHTLQLLGAASWTRADSDAETGAGSFLFASVERAGRGFSFGAEFEDITADFDAQSGFLRRTGVTRAQGTVRQNFYGAPGALVERVGPFFELEGTWDRDAFWDGSGLEEGSVRLGGSVSLRGNVTVFGTYSRGRFDVPGSRYEGLFVEAEGGADPVAFVPRSSRFSSLDGASLRGFFSPWERVRGSFGFEYGEMPVFDRLRDVPVEVGDRWGGNLNLTLLPTPALRAEVGVRHESLLRKRDGSRYSSATIPRLRLQYQFTRALYVRAIAEYAAQERGPLLDPVSGRALLRCGETCVPITGSTANDVHLEGLLAYEPTPGTVVFVGYTRDWEDDAAFEFRDLRPRADGVFVKLSYRFRY